MSQPQDPSVVVFVGTDHHPFGRLVGWIDDWLSSRPECVPCLVQHGRSAPPRLAEGVPFLEHAEVERLMSAARVVVSHGGPTTIAEARRRGHHPLVVARDPRLGEHVDDHQQRFAGRLAAGGLIELVTSPEELHLALDTRLKGPVTQLDCPGGPDPAESARRFGVVVDALVSGWDSRNRLAR